MPPPRPLPYLLTAVLLPVAVALIGRTILQPSAEVALPALETSLGFSILALLATLHLVPALGADFVKAGLSGKDMLKASGDVIPECMGLICASVYILLLTLFIPFPFSHFFARSFSPSLRGLTTGDFPHQQLANYLSALLSFMAATLLGFLDDVFDIRWRHKLPIPIIASIPLLLVYYAEQGLTTVVMPIPFRPIFGTIVELGPLYYFYMSLLSTFCTNSINILAGVNGIEVSQALVIAISVALNDALYLPWPLSVRVPGMDLEMGGEWGAGLARGSRELVERHLLSLYFMLPLIGACLGLLYHNWYPARAFPGDTFCYFAGMAFAVAGILGHYSKTLLLFFLPQVFNFILSCPQLFGLVPCPRHRLPRLDKETNLLLPSLTPFPAPPPLHTTLTLRLLSTLHLTRLTYSPPSSSSSPSKPHITASTNLTLPNVLLNWLGPMSEERLALAVTGCQVAGSVVAFAVRYGVAGWVYDGDRR